MRFMSIRRADGPTAGLAKRLSRRRKALAFLALAFTPVMAGSSVAGAHQWGQWHWHRGGGAVYIYVWNGCESAWVSMCEAARYDIHKRPHPVYLSTVDTHTDISMLSGNFGATGWVGLAEMINYTYPHVTHAHATFNTYYGYSGLNAQGVMCQEIAHTLGLDHAATGDCMAKGYYSGATNYFGADSSASGTSHPTGDLKNMYSTLK